MSRRADDDDDDVQSTYYIYGAPKTESTSGRSGGRLTASVDVDENPLCPRIGGLCCLLLLFNLALALICLGFVVVVQLPPDPVYIWWVGVFMLVFGFVTLVGSFVYCYFVCRRHRIETEEASKVVDGRSTGDPRWTTHHWSKTFNFGNNEINYDNDPTSYPRNNNNRDESADNRSRSESPRR